MKKPFCYWHIKTQENPDGTDCSAHLHESRCFPCSYDINNIKTHTLFGKFEFYISHTASDLIGACQDFDLTEELKNKLKNVLDNKKLETLKSILNS